jgi:hypothetical protein
MDLNATRLLDRLAETAYAKSADPARVVEGLFGRFISTPECPRWRDGNQLFDVRCGTAQLPALEAELDRHYAGLGLPYRLLTGHDVETYERLWPVLEGRGWRGSRTWILAAAQPSSREPNPDVTVEAAAADDPRVFELQVAAGRRPEGARFQQAHAARLGGQTFVASVDGRPAGTTGWFAVDGVGRYRWVGVAPWARQRGVASTLIQYVRALPEVQALDALALFCNFDGPLALYEQLGFRRQGFCWELLWEES